MQGQPRFFFSPHMKLIYWLDCSDVIWLSLVLMVLASFGKDLLFLRTRVS